MLTLLSFSESNYFCSDSCSLRYVRIYSTEGNSASGVKSHARVDQNNFVSVEGEPLLNLHRFDYSCSKEDVLLKPYSMHFDEIV